MVTSRGIMIVQEAYDLLLEEKQEGESYSECIIRLIEEIRLYRLASNNTTAETEENEVLDYIKDIEVETRPLLDDTSID